VTRPTIALDCDPGHDDAVAIVLAGQHTEIDVITTVSGNAPLTATTRNALMTAQIAGIDVAVHSGAERPLVATPHHAPEVHGESGLDGPTLPEPSRTVAGDDAVGRLIAASRRHDDLWVVAIGPLTNVALALDLDERALRRLARLVVMGGAVDVPGNVTPAAEFNIHVDPDAAARVLAAGLPVDLVPLDATRQAVLSRAALEQALQRRPGPVATRVAAFTRRGFTVDRACGTAGMVLHDPLAVAAALDPGLVGWEETRLQIEGDGATRRAAGPVNCRFARTVDAASFLAAFLDRLCPAS
jgi:inosine-uridine nucleoside N-ribohydrolase